MSKQISKSVLKDKDGDVIMQGCNVCGEPLPLNPRPISYPPNSQSTSNPAKFFNPSTSQPIFHNNYYKWQPQQPQTNSFGAYSSSDF